MVTLPIVGVDAAEIFPLATTFRTLVPLPRLIALKPAHWLVDIVTVSLPLLPVSVSTLLAAPVVKLTVVALVRTIASVSAPPSIDSPEAKSPLAR